MSASQILTKARNSCGRFGLACLLVAAMATAGTAADAQSTVHIDNFTFNPPELTVSVGTTVTWQNADDIPHTVVATGKLFRSKPLDTEDHFSFTFTTVGSYDYFCSLHPHMTGKIVVTP